MSGGAGNPVSRAIGSIDSAINGGSSNSSMPVYGANTPVRTTGDANKYTASYQQPTQNVSQNVQDMGLEALYQSMASQFAPISQQFNPMDRFYQQPVQQQMPTYQSPALNYRPDMTNAQQNLSRVSPSVAEINRRQAIEDARIAAEQYTYGGGE